MVSLTSLWLPILVSAVALFFLSFLSWMVLPHHKSDWKGVPDDQAFRDALNGLNIPPGNYMFPYAETSAEMQSAEFLERQRQGPNGTLQLWEGLNSMSRNLVMQFLYLLGSAFCLAYLGTLGLASGADFMAVFRFMGTAGILMFTAGSIPHAIWFKFRLPGYLVDGLLNGLAVGLIFASLWPAAG